MPPANRNPLVTVIIPAYGRPQLLLTTLRSVYSQENISVKAVVIDDHSKKPLRKIVKKHFPQVVFIRNSRNLRSGPTRNVGLGHVSTPYAAFLDADDVWVRGFLESSILTLEKNKASVASICLSKPLFSKQLSKKFIVKLLILSAIRDSFQLFFHRFNHQAMPRSAFYLCQLSHLVFRSDKVKKLKFDPKYNYGGEDWKYVLESTDFGGVSIIPKRLVNYRYHPSSATHNFANILKKWQSYNQLFAETKKRNVSGVMLFLFRKYIDTFKG